jgi:hypothetical protein
VRAPWGLPYSHGQSCTFEGREPRAVLRFHRDHHDCVKRRRLRGMRVEWVPFLALDFQKVPPTPTSKINLKGRVVCFTFASRVRGHPWNSGRMSGMGVCVR